MSKIIIKFFLALIYNIYLKNWDIDYINKITQTFNKIFKAIYL